MLTVLIIDPIHEVMYQFWNPCKIKMETFSFIWANNIQDGLKSCPHDNVFITPVYGIPTYHTLVCLENIKANQIVAPTWHPYRTTDRNVPALESFSISKSLYRGETKQEYIKQTGHQVLLTPKLYYVGK